MKHNAPIFGSCNGRLWSTPDPCVVVELPGGTELVSDLDHSAPISLAEWDGWTNGGRQEGGAESWENADGGRENPVYLGGRDLAFSGHIRGRSAQHMWELMEELGSVGTSSRWGTVTVYEQHLGLERQVRAARAAKPVLTPLSSRFASYQLQLQTADWRRVAVDAQSATITAGGVVLQNLGTAPASLTLTLTGPLSNPGISWSGGAWQYSGTVASGTTLTVDLERRIVRNPATSAHSRRLASGTWLQLPPGSTTVSRTGSGSGSISASWRSSWA